jgi:hypothetical protein
MQALKQKNILEDMSDVEIQLLNRVTILVQPTEARIVYWTVLVQGKNNMIGWGSIDTKTSKINVIGICKYNKNAYKTYTRRLQDQGYKIMSTGSVNNIKLPVQNDWWNDDSNSFDTWMEEMAIKNKSYLRVTNKNVFQMNSDVALNFKDNLKIVQAIEDHVTHNKVFQRPVSSGCVSPESCMIGPSSNRSTYEWKNQPEMEKACGQWYNGSSFFDSNDEEATDKYFEKDDEFYDSIFDEDIL